MSEGAEFSVITFFSRLKIGRAKFGFILVRMIEFFHSIVRFLAALSVRTLLMVFNIPTFLGLVVSQWSSSIFLIVMIIGTFLEVMALRVTYTSHRLKEIKIKERHTLAHLNVLSSIVAILQDMLVP